MFIIVPFIQQRKAHIEVSSDCLYEERTSDKQPGDCSLWLEWEWWRCGRGYANLCWPRRQGVQRRHLLSILFDYAPQHRYDQFTIMTIRAKLRKEHECISEGSDSNINTLICEKGLSYTKGLTWTLECVSCKFYVKLWSMGSVILTWPSRRSWSAHFLVCS